MKKTIDIESLKLNILQPIVTIFVIFFLMLLFTSFCLEKYFNDHTSTHIVFYIITLLLLTLALFFIIKSYLDKFSNRIINIYNKNLKDLKFSEHYLKVLEDTSPNLIISAVDDGIEKVNETFLHFTGFKSLDSFHKNHKCISELFITRRGYLNTTVAGEHWLEYVLNRPHILHKAILQKDKKEYIFIVNAKILNIDEKSRSLSTFVDITELENLEKRFELAINGIEDGLWDWDLVHDTLYFSPQWKKMLGYEDFELKNELQTWQERVHPDDLEKAFFDIQQNVEGKTTKYENQHRIKHKDGSWVWILDRGQTIFDDNGKAVRMIGFHSNITEKMLIEQELHNKDEMMIAQSQNAAMGEMISMIAHQWRQPLSVISMGANNILADIELELLSKESLQEVSSEIIIQTNELSKTIDDFRDFFKPRREKETILIQNVFDDTLGIIGKSLENNEITLIQDFQSTQKIQTYSRELLQVLLNILKNSKEILVENKIENKTIIVKTQDDKQNVIIEILDNAGGIPLWVIPKIFDPYFSTKNDKTGTGLGLYMSKTIVEKHLNGTITASNKNDGACFKITIKNDIHEK